MTASLPGSLQAFKAEFFNALAHPLRIRMLEILAGGGRTVQELGEPDAEHILLFVIAGNAPEAEYTTAAKEILDEWKARAG